MSKKFVLFLFFSFSFNVTSYFEYNYHKSNNFQKVSVNHVFKIKEERDSLNIQFENIPNKQVQINDDVDFRFEINSSADNGSSQLLTIGLDSLATDGLDFFLGEQELPPPPPNDSYFIRFNLPNSFISSFSDIRYGIESNSYYYEYELLFQLGENSTKLFLEWYQPAGIQITIQDMFGGVIINEEFTTGQNYYVLLNPNISSLKLIVNYDYITTVQQPSQPSDYTLSQNYPNPFNPTTMIKYTIPNVETLHATSNMQNVTLKVFDLLGREVATLVNEQKKPGNYQVQFDASNLSSGLYFYKIQAVNFNQVRKMMLLK